MEIGTELWGTEGIAEDDGVGQTCWRSISDWYLTTPNHWTLQPMENIELCSTFILVVTNDY